MTTVKELIEKLQKMESCAQVVFTANGSEIAGDFDVQGYGNVSRVTIIIHEYENLAEQVKSLEREVEDSERGCRDAENRAERLENRLEAIREAVNA